MPPSQTTADVSIVGLGRVGLPLALCFADRGLRVIGVDRDPARVSAVGDGRMPFAETGAQQLLDRGAARDPPAPADRGAQAARAAGPPDPPGPPSLPPIRMR